MHTIRQTIGQAASGGFLALALVGGLVAAPAEADATSDGWSTPQVLATYTSSPSVAVNGQNAIATYLSNDNSGSPLPVPILRSTDGGGPWTRITESLASPERDSRSPEVLATGNGWLAKWFDRTTRSIRIATSTDGATWNVNPVGLGTYASSNWVAVDGLNVAAAWTSEQQVDGIRQFSVWAAFSTDGGQTWGTPRLLTDGAARAGNPQLWDARVAVHGSTALVTWNYTLSVTPEHSWIEGSLTSDAGATWSASPFPIGATFTGGVPDHFDELGQPYFSGSSWVVGFTRWGGANLSQPQPLYATSTDGATWGPAVPLASAGAGMLASMAFSDSVWAAVWKNTLGTYITVSTDQGATWSAKTLEATAGETRNPPAVVASGRTLVAAWEGLHPDASIYYATSTDSGATWSSGLLSTEGAARYKFSPELFVGGGQVVATYVNMASNERTSTAIYTRSLAIGSVPEPNPPAPSSTQSDAPAPAPAPQPTAIPTQAASPVPTPATTTTMALESTAELGVNGSTPTTPVGPVTLVDAGTADAARKRYMIKPPSTRIGKAPKVRATIADPLALVMRDMTPGRSYTVRVRVRGTYNTIGTVTPTQARQAFLPAMKFSTAGNYTFALVAPSGDTRYLKVVVS